MIKNFLIGFFLCFYVVCGSAQVIPNNSLQTIEGSSITLSNYYSNKKLLLILLPVLHTSANSLVLLSMDSMYRQHQQQVSFIGIPSVEDGFSGANALHIKNWYRDTLHLSFPILTGMYTYNSSGGQQSPIFKWLSNENLNGHFKKDINAPGFKFLINQSGELKAVFDPLAKVGNKLMNMILRL